MAICLHSTSPLTVSTQCGSVARRAVIRFTRAAAARFCRTEGGSRAAVVAWLLARTRLIGEDGHRGRAARC